MRLKAVTTELPLLPDKPISFGTHEFCMACESCAKYCPPGAVPKGEPTDLPGMHRFRDTFMLAHNAHLLLGIYEDEWGNKLLHIAGLRSSNGKGDVTRDIPIVVREQDGVIVEALPETHLL